MTTKQFDLATAYEFLTREQLDSALGMPKRVVDRLIARGELTQYRSGPGIGRGGQRVFYARSQVLRVKAALRGRKKKGTRSRV